MMKDKDKKQEQLIKELDQLRRRIAKLEASGRKRNQFEEALREERDKAKHYLDVAEVMLVALNKRGEITLINRKGNQILGYKEGELLGKNWFTTCLPSPYRKDVKGIFLKLMAGQGKVTEFYENPVLTKSGPERIIAWYNTLLKDEKGNLIGTLSSGMDITERKLAEKKLRENEERYRTLFDEALVGICLADVETGTIIDCNEAMVALVGRKQAELIGKSQKILHPMQDDEELFSPTFKQHLTNKEGLILETQLITKTGNIREVEIKANLLDLQGRKVLQGLFHDITERKQAEEALRRSEDKYRTILKNIQEGYYEVDLAGNFTFFNDAMCRIWGYPKEELMGMNNRQYMDKENAKKLFRAFNKVYKTGKIGKGYDYEIIKKDGSRSYVEASISLRKDSSGKAIGFRGIIRDISDRKRSEKELRESEERFRLAFENANTGVCLVDLEGNLTRINNKMSEIFGYTKEELEHMTVNDIAHPEDVDLSPEFIQKTLRGELDRSTFEKRYFHKKGHVVTCEVSSSLVRDAAGTPLYFISHVNDITERKRAEEALRESEENFRRSLDDSPLGIRIVTAEGETLYANQAALEIYGYDSLEELQRTPVKERYTPESYAEFQARKEKRDQGEFGPSEYEISIVRKNGEIRRVQVFRKEIIWNGQRQFQVIYQDITQRKKAEAQIERALRETRLRFEISQALAGTPTEDEVLDVLINHAGLYPQAYVAILTFDKQEDEVAFIVRRSHPFESGVVTIVPIGERFPASKFTIVNLHINGHELVSNDTFSDERVDPNTREIFNQIETASLATFPLRDGNEMTGLIVAVAKPPNFFDEEKQHLYRTLAEQGAVALQASRLREQIRESQQRFQGLVETLNDWIWEIDQNGIYTYASPRVKDLLGYETQEVLGKTPFDLMPPEEAERVKGIFESLMAKKQALVALENTNRHKDGHLVVFETSGMPFSDAEGCFKGYRGVDRDITKRKKTEEALRERQETISAIIDTSQDWIWAIDSQGVHTYSNPAIEKILGYRSDEIVGNISFNLMHEDDKKWAESLVQECREKQCGWNNLLLRWRHKDGTYRYLESNAVPILNNKGDLVGFRGVDRDISDRKQMEERLKESEAQFRTLFGAIPDSILVHDHEGTILHINEIGARQLEWSTQDLIGRNLREIVTPENHAFIADHIRETHKTGWCRFETTYVSRSGWKIVVDVNDHSINFGKKKAILRVARDITERKEAERKLRESEEKYRDLVENISDIIYATDEAGIVTYISPTIESIGGYTDAEIIGRSFLAFVYKEDMSNVEQFFQQDISGQAEPRECRMMAKAGDVRWVRISSRPIFEGTRIVGLRGILTDISERKQAEEAVKRGYEQLQETFQSTVTALASTVEMKDQYTAGHQPRVTQLACAIAEEMGLPPEQIEGIRMAASIHDIGKIMVPAEILNKPGPLTEIQYEMIKMHPRAGYDILKGLKLPWPVAQIILQHHELMNGSGYPQKLSGEKIMTEARILTVANVVEAMNSHRPYRPAYDIKEALAEISKNRGILYDAAAVDACLQLFAEKRFAFD